MAEEDKSAEPRTTTRQSTIKKTTAKAKSSISQTPNKRTETLHCSRSTVSQKCTGRITFSANEINELAELLHVSADVLLGRAPLEVK